MRYRISHTTKYDYADQVSQGYNIAYLIPRDCRGQRVVYSDIRIDPVPATRIRREDYYGNVVCQFSVEKPHRSLSVTVESEIEIAPSESRLLGSGITCGEVLKVLEESRAQDDIEATEFCFDSPMLQGSNELADFGRDLFPAERPFMEAVAALNSRIFTDFQYDPGFSTVATPLAEVLENRRGVCQDFAHLAIAVLRSLGFAARYVSGYLETLPPPGQQKLQGADASHAWFSVYVPGDGWNDFDPTNDLIPADQHITTGWGRDYSDVTPLKGIVFGGGSDQSLTVAVDVERVS
ncbi:transglutaminase family protein [Spongiibacter taiwanensis]|uniref:transglutaminase family protein n=1 Tax=Spongiibacter taiwanensis TaxID=1748242 RepID=UPI002034F6D2|nr:transglutaminase family protein [Spongiibacter taiwanensis]USA44067.1 transglutaminase family protein [Spongiibacter taiwanensis]